MLSDLDFVGTVEADGHNRPFISPWERTQHEGALRFPDFRHFIIEAGADGSRDGFVILQGCRNPHRSVDDLQLGQHLLLFLHQRAALVAVGLGCLLYTYPSPRD